MKNIYYWMGILLLLILAGCSDIDENEGQTVNVESITFQGITNDTIYLKKGDKYQLAATTIPANSPVKFYNTTSESFKVNQSTGEITALAGGVGTVIAIAPNGDSWTKAYCQVSVTENVAQITVSAENIIQILSSGTRAVSSYFTVLPYTVTNKTLTYESSHPEFATVDPHTGVVTYVSKGYTEIIAKAVDGSNISSEPIQVYSGYATTAIPRNNPAWTATASSTEPPVTGTYRPGRAIDGSTSGGNFWHASWSNPPQFPLYFQIDFGSARTLSEVEIYRRSSPQMDVRDVEFYIIPANITTEDGITWTDERYVQWGTLSFYGGAVSGTGVDARNKLFRTFPETVTSRYLMLKLLNTNRNADSGDMSIAEIVPRITQ
jgi:hypothetical protein